VIAVLLALAAAALVAPLLAGSVELSAGFGHDRNRHLVEAQRLAVDLRAWDVLAWLRDAERMRLYPPLHAIAASVPLAITGLDLRAAVAPSVFGWWLTGVMVFAAARRCAPGARTSAGVVALSLFLGSAAHRRYASDVMLESLGAGLTLAAVLAFMTTVQTGSRRASRTLGLALSLLLAFKYNYWLLAATAIGAGALWEWWVAGERAARRREVAAIAFLVWPKLRSPLVFVSLVLFVLGLVVAAGGGGEFELGGRRISVTKPYTLFHLAYLLIFLRLLRWWFRERTRWLAGIDARLRDIVVWHGVPAAVFFALPRRLGYVLRHVGLDNHQSDGIDIRHAIEFYGPAWVLDYHVGWWTAALAAAGVGFALVRIRRLPPGSVAVAALFAVSLALTLLHPNHQSRYLHAWVAASWVLAGAGAGAVLSRIRAPLAGAATVAAAAVLLAPIALGVARGPELAAVAAPSLRVVTERYLPWLDGGGQLGVVSNLPVAYAVEWTFVERGGDRSRLEFPLANPGADVMQARERESKRFLHWVQETRADQILELSFARKSGFYFKLPSENGTALTLLHEQDDFVPVPDRRSEIEGVTLQLWRRP